MMHQAIRNIYSNATIIKELTESFEVYDENEDLISIDWDLVNAENTKLLNEETALAYSRTRHYEYPDIRNQLDMLWHAIDADTLDKTSDFYTTLKAVKDAHPKG